MSIPRFTAEASLYKINGDNKGVLIEPVDSMQVLLQYHPCIFGWRPNFGWGIYCPGGNLK